MRNPIIGSKIRLVVLCNLLICLLSIQPGRTQTEHFDCLSTTTLNVNGGTLKYPVSGQTDFNLTCAWMYQSNHSLAIQITLLYFDTSYLYGPLFNFLVGETHVTGYYEAGSILVHSNEIKISTFGVNTGFALAYSFLPALENQVVTRSYPDRFDVSVQLLSSNNTGDGTTAYTVAVITATGESASLSCADNGTCTGTIPNLSPGTSYDLLFSAVKTALPSIYANNVTLARIKTALACVNATATQTFSDRVVLSVLLQPPPSPANKFIVTVMTETGQTASLTCAADGTCVGTLGSLHSGTAYTLTFVAKDNAVAQCDALSLTSTTATDVDGSWTEWAEWKTCTPICGQNQTQSRSRNCTNPAPQFNGLNCNGSNYEEQQGLADPCPVHGNWSQWGEWTSCNGTCGVPQLQSRNRTCDNPAPEYNGNNCIGYDIEQRICSLAPCSVYAKFMWLSFGVDEEFLDTYRDANSTAYAKLNADCTLLTNAVLLDAVPETYLSITHFHFVPSIHSITPKLKDNAKVDFPPMINASTLVEMNQIVSLGDVERKVTQAMTNYLAFLGNNGNLPLAIPTLLFTPINEQVTTTAATTVTLKASGKSNNDGAIIGGVLGGLALLALLAALIYWCYAADAARRRWRLREAARNAAVHRIYQPQHPAPWHGMWFPRGFATGGI